MWTWTVAEHPNRCDERVEWRSRNPLMVEQRSSLNQIVLTWFKIANAAASGRPNAGPLRRTSKDQPAQPLRLCLICQRAFNDRDPVRSQRGLTRPARLILTRPQILAFRRRVGALDQRLPMGTRSLRRAAWPA
jgi:hypothetical protein